MNLLLHIYAGVALFALGVIVATKDWQKTLADEPGLGLCLAVLGTALWPLVFLVSFVQTVTEKESK